MGFGVEGLAFTPFERHASSSAARSRYHWRAVWGLEFGVQGSGFRVSGFGFRVSGFVLRNEALELTFRQGLPGPA